MDETFSTISGEEIHNIYQLVIEKAVDLLEPFDAIVSKTVDTIINSFFENSQNSLIYICSDSADKAKIRFKVFDRWYKNSSYNNIVKKIDNIININISNSETSKLYTSFLYHIENPCIEKLSDIYYSIESILNKNDA